MPFSTLLCILSTVKRKLFKQQKVIRQNNKISVMLKFCRSFDVQSERKEEKYLMRNTGRQNIDLDYFIIPARIQN
jgi:hypothetical protein